MKKKICKKLFSPRQFQTIFRQKCSNLRPLLCITFPQGIRISKTSESGGKKTFKWYLKSEHMKKKKSVKNFFLPRRFKTIFFAKNSNLRPLLSTTFPKGFRCSKKFVHPTSGSWGKKMFKRYLKSEHTDRRIDGHADRRTFRLIEN